ncbi:hypothetical protein [Erwinia phage Kuerle]|nr:hypothetical protein [Erwinia phage Kuerle]
MIGVLNELLSEGVIHSDCELVCGMARGADMTAYACFKDIGNTIHEYWADWDGLGKRAGFVRNTEMAQVADIGVAFWDGSSRGTKHMIDTLDRLNKPCYVVRYAVKP